MPELRYGLIGAGMMGQEHIRNIALLDGVRVAAVADPDDRMRAASSELAGPGCTAFSDHRDLLAAEPCDAWIIAAPNDLHHPILLDALETAKPILCEKPLCTTAADAADIVRRAADRPAPVWVAMEYRYMPPVARLLAKVRAGEAGTPRMIAIREHRFPFLDKVGDWNRFNARTGGTLVEKCCHFWDLMRLGLGADPVRVWASAGQDVNHLDERYDGRRPDIVDNAFVVVDFEGGARGHARPLHVCRGQPLAGDHRDHRGPGPDRGPGSRPGPILGLRRGAAGGGGGRRSRPAGRDPRNGGRRSPNPPRGRPPRRDLLPARAGSGAWRRRVRGEAEVSLADGWWAVLVGEAAEESARTGAPVDLRGRGP